MLTDDQMRELPGGDLVATGLEDLRAGRQTTESLLVLIGAPKLRSLGFDIPSVDSVENPEHALYFGLAETGEDSAHSRYNALVRRLVSFERAVSCAQ